MRARSIRRAAAAAALATGLIISAVSTFSISPLPSSGMSPEDVTLALITKKPMITPQIISTQKMKHVQHQHGEQSRSLLQHAMVLSAQKEYVGDIFARVGRGQTQGISLKCAWRSNNFFFWEKCFARG